MLLLSEHRCLSCSQSIWNWMCSISRVFLVYFQFSLYQGNFSTSSLMHSLTHCLFRTVLNFHGLESFLMLPLLLISSFVPWLLEYNCHPPKVAKLCLWRINNSCSAGQVTLLFWNEMFCACLFSQDDLECCSNTLVLHLFCLDHHSC